METSKIFDKNHGVKILAIMFKKLPFFDQNKIKMVIKIIKKLVNNIEYFLDKNCGSLLQSSV